VSHKWVVNASPLIVLAKISLRHLLPVLSSDLVIPDGVAREINEGPVDDPANTWIQSSTAAYIYPSEPIEPIVAAWDFGLGETPVLSCPYFGRKLGI
jgi:hypothetical protein